MNIKKCDNVSNNEELLEEVIEKTGLTDEEIKIYPDIVLSNREDAEALLEDLLFKFPCVVIKYLETTANFEDTEVCKDLTEKITLAENNYANFPETLVQNFSDQKSTNRGCNKCKSSINKDFYVDKLNIKLSDLKENAEDFENMDYLKRYSIKSDLLNCPICDSEEFILTKTDEKQLKTLDNKIKDAQKKLKEQQIEFEVKTEKNEVTILATQSEIEDIEED